MTSAHFRDCVAYYCQLPDHPRYVGLDAIQRLHVLRLPMLSSESRIRRSRWRIARRSSSSARAETDYAELLAESPAAGFLAKPELSAREIRRILGHTP